MDKDEKVAAPVIIEEEERRTDAVGLGERVKIAERVPVDVAQPAPNEAEAEDVTLRVLIVVGKMEVLVLLEAVMNNRVLPALKVGESRIDALRSGEGEIFMLFPEVGLLEAGTEAANEWEPVRAALPLGRCCMDELGRTGVSVGVAVAAALGVTDESKDDGVGLALPVIPPDCGDNEPPMLTVAVVMRLPERE